MALDATKTHVRIASNPHARALRYRQGLQETLPTSLCQRHPVPCVDQEEAATRSSMAGSIARVMDVILPLATDRLVGTVADREPQRETHESNMVLPEATATTVHLCEAQRTQGIRVMILVKRQGASR